MRTLPAEVRDPVEAALARAGAGRRIERVEPVSGGCINHGARLRTNTGAELFLKWNAQAPAGLFEAEARGLEALRTAEGPRVPRVVDVRAPDDPVGWLLLELVETGRPAPDFDERLGRGLAHLHASCGHGAAWGWEEDNWIGSLPQGNAPTPSWGAFWRDRRLAPQLEWARAAGHFAGADGALLDRLLDRTEDALAEAAPAPHLLHGDLWSGNAFADAGGAPVVIDPAVYRGHGEVDLAMTELFGGFGARMYDAYAEVLPLDPAYAAWRRDLYQLYYLLVHVNLFGAGYVGPSLGAARRAAGTLG